MQPARRGLVLGWMHHSQRSSTLAARLGADAVLLDRPGRGRRWTAPLAYVWLALRTVALLLRRRPPWLVVVAPPFVAPLVAVPLARLMRARVAIDVHSGALLDRRWLGTGRLLRLAARAADGAIVTLAALAPRIRSDALVLPDPLPVIEATAVPQEDLVVGICGWAPDEPIPAMIQAAIDRPWRLVLTGGPRGAPRVPSNVRLAGHLPDSEYHRLLASAACIVVLTTREHTLLSGVWEALSVGRPIVTSDTAALRSTFGEAVRYARPDAASIRAEIEASLTDRNAPGRVAQAASRLRSANDAALEHLRHLLEPVGARREAMSRDRDADEPPQGL